MAFTNVKPSDRTPAAGLFRANGDAKLRSRPAGRFDVDATPMSDARHLQLLIRYSVWGNEQLFDALARLPEAELLADREIVFGNILRTLNHVYAMDHVWRCHLTGVSHGLSTRNPPDCPPFAQLRAAQEEMDRWYLGYVDALEPSRMAEVVEFAFIDGDRGTMTREEILLHVANHRTYHRGHVAALMYQVPVFPPTTDLPVFVRSLGPAG